MKSYCQSNDIVSEEYIKGVLLDTLSDRKKRMRTDAIELFSEVTGFDISVSRAVMENPDERRREFMLFINKMAHIMSGELACKRVSFPEAKRRKKRDGLHGKVRIITVGHMKQLLYDAIAVDALMPAFMAHLGEYQVSGLPKRGVAKGKHAIELWIRGKRRTYFCKLDVKKYFDSFPREKFIRWLKKRVKNERLMYLIKKLIFSTKEGIPIGSYLSQTIANMYLSRAYHEVMGRMHSQKGERLVEHALFYMDDILLVGHNKRHLMKAKEQLMGYLKSKLGLTVKVTAGVQQVGEVKKGVPIVMLGFRFRKHCTTLNKQIYRKVKHVVSAAHSLIHEKGPQAMCVGMAYALVSYKGYIDSTNTKRLANRYRLRYIFRVARRTISEYAKTKAESELWQGRRSTLNGPSL